MGKEMRRELAAQLQMPPGFRFCPTDEELIVHYLCKKAAAHPFAVPIIAEVDLYKFDPWDLPEKALVGEKEWYFFSPRDRKYPNGSRPNRAAGSGFWKATGVDKPISTLGGSLKVGVKKALVFYEGRAPKGVKTNWIMHEYRLADSGSKAAKRKGSLRLDDWVLCRIYNKTSSAEKALSREDGEERKPCLDDLLASLPGTDEFKLPDLFQLNSLQGCREMEEDAKSDPKAVSHLSNEESGHDSVGDNSEDSTLSSWLSFSSSVEQAPLCPSTPPPPFALLPPHSPPLSSHPLPPPLSPPPATAATSTTSTHPVSSRPLLPPLSAPPPPAIYTTTTTTSSTAAAAAAATCAYATQPELFPFNFDGLPSPYGRLEPLQSPFFGDGGDLGGYFGSEAPQYLQGLD